MRESGPRAAAFAPGAPPEWEGWDDAAVAPEKLGALPARYPQADGRIRLSTALSTDISGTAAFTCASASISKAKTAFATTANSSSAPPIWWSATAARSPASMATGNRAARLLPKMFGPELMKAFGEFKAVWDPQNKLNPHKVVDAYLPTENLRLGADYKPLQPETHFKFLDDGGPSRRPPRAASDSGDAASSDSGSMCPSYMATLEEEHSTRGRAHMLFELLQGEVIDGGWKDEQVKKALDLCLSCKACKSECPANVDIATYKAEFLSHYYEDKRRPLHAYAFGMIDRWAQLGSHAPRIANFMSTAPKQLMQKALDLAPQRQMPRLAPRSFQRWARKHRVLASGGSVILWPDTFNNYFNPETSQAALEVLTHAGFNVMVPQDISAAAGRSTTSACSIRPRNICSAFCRRSRPRSTPACPSLFWSRAALRSFATNCATCFLEDARAGRLQQQTFLLSEFLEHHAPGYQPPQLSQKLLLHGHCHHKALMKMNDEEALLRKMGADLKNSRLRLLRNGRPLRVREREVRSVAGDRRARAAAGGEGSGAGHTHRLRRIQLPRADTRKPPEEKRCI